MTVTLPSSMELRHLRREVSTSLELALAAMAPRALIESLATTAGLLAALEELPLETESLVTWAKEALVKAEKDLQYWRQWEAQRKASA